jgi:hypothetical protein
VEAVTVNTDPAQEQEWLRQNNLIYGGLIGIGVVLVQPFLTAASLDLSATICVVAVLVCGLVGIAVHPAGYVRLEFKEPGDTESWPWPDPAPRRCSSHCRLRSPQMVLYRR